ncbi:hypothetical protein BT96DRAFT_1016551 [Gymnopus androsaceus JB14]|uniref:Uncharacterized protein n=1 Tax=Gymnopus androsaceus JB14 TaxID=1447944 RepID=A0A6A4I2J9_9AGAR|nr:hypothetical protein BT96DRAFT_1016551 [Gymnopus androsaceus JB14]
MPLAGLIYVEPGIEHRVDPESGTWLSLHRIAHAPTYTPSALVVEVDFCRAKLQRSQEPTQMTATCFNGVGRTMITSLHDLGFATAGCNEELSLGMVQEVLVVRCSSAATSGYFRFEIGSVLVLRCSLGSNHTPPASRGLFTASYFLCLLTHWRTERKYSNSRITLIQNRCGMYRWILSLSYAYLSPTQWKRDWGWDWNKGRRPGIPAVKTGSLKFVYLEVQPLFIQ